MIAFVRHWEGHQDGLAFADVGIILHPLGIANAMLGLFLPITSNMGAQTIANKMDSSNNKLISKMYSSSS